ncbi:ABC transporter permease [Nocardioides sp.]|uniref:ABC transporter permease n=1 Tax=Nocardioides sp. TaxID=35761 RepID=UPI003514B5B8
MSTPTGTSPTPIWRVVAQREIDTQLRSKAFRISTAIMLLGIVGLTIALRLLGGQESTATVAVVGDSATGIVAAADDLTEGLDDAHRLEERRVADTAAAEQAVRDGDVDLALLPTADGFELVGADSLDPVVSQALTAAVSQVVTQRNADADGVDLAALARGTSVGERLLNTDVEDADLRSSAAFFFVLVFYATAVTFGSAIASAVVTEKESRVVEILAAAVPIRALLWGKVIGNSAVALGQVALLVATTAISLAATGNTDALGTLAPALGWYVPFFLLGFVALAGVWSVAGSIAGRTQDLGATTTPINLLLFAPYLLAVSAGDQVKETASLLPVISTMVMPSRLAEGEVPLWQLGVALGGTALATVLLVRISARVYEATVLRTGRRIGYREALWMRAD